MKIFLGAPIQQVQNQDGLVMPNVKSMIEYIIETLQKEHNQVFSAHVEEEFGRVTESFSDEDICKRDYKWMNECDTYIAVFPNDAKNKMIQSAGTNVELGWATTLNKEIVLIYDFSKKQQLSKLVRGLQGIAHVKCINLNEVMKDAHSLTQTL